MKKRGAILATLICLLFIVSCRDKVFEFTEVDGGYIVSGYTGDKTEIIIPSKYDGQSVVGIGKNAFYNNQELKAVKLPNTITYIESGAFYSCYDLESINLPKSVERIEAGAFEGCEFINYERVGGCNYIDGWLISLYDKDQTTIDVRDGTTGIYGYAFFENKKIKEVKLPDTLKYIGEKAFKNCSSLEKINLPDSVRTLSSDALYGCDSLKYEVVGGANYINNWLISRQDESLGELNVREGTVGIYSYAFYDSYMLVKITIPSSVKVIGDNAFFNCMYVKELTIAEGVEEIGMYAFYKCIKIKPINIPASVKKIGTGAFVNCRSEINCAVPSQPEGYQEGWSGSLRVNYGAK